MTICAVSGCNTKGGIANGIHLHQFPRSEQIRKIWVLKCCRLKKINCDSARMCSRHFTPDDYQRNLKYELLNLPVPAKLMRLKSSAIPSLLLPNTTQGRRPRANSVFSHNQPNNSVNGGKF